MDKYEYKIRADEIKELIARGDYVQAAEIADTIDWRRVKSVMMLCTISDLYKINRRYEDARDMLLLAYDRRPGGRTICYSLCELSVKMEEYVQAVEYYKEFVQAAPRDPGRYILQYKIYEAQDVSLEERIEVLEELKKRDYREKWAYELAYLYHRIGLATRCVEECDELILWFGEGKYVIKAMELKRLHQPLTAVQQEKYDRRFDRIEEAAEAPRPAEEVVEEAPASDFVQEEDNDTIAYEAVPLEDALNLGDVDIHVKTVNVGEYNTMNLEAELAAGLKEVLDESSITEAIVAPMLESDTESLDYPQIDEVSEDDLDLTGEEIEHSEVFFGETGELGNILATREEQSDGQDAELPQDLTIEWAAVMDADLEPEPVVLSDTTAEIVMEQMRQEEIGQKDQTILNAEPPKELAKVLSQEADGQISLVMPEAENIEKQITGQMSIEDILAEWERVKKENEEKRKEEVRQHVLQQTGTMFTEFEASVRDGLLEQLESGKIDSVAKAVDMAEMISESKETFKEEAVAQAQEEIPEEVVIEAPEATPEEEVTQAQEEISEEVVAEASEEILEEATQAQEEISEASYEISEEKAAEVADETAFEEDAETEDIVWDVEDVYSEEEEPSELSQTSEKAEENIVQEQPKIRKLTKEERELYDPFVQSKKGREQLVSAIDSISLAAYTGNIVITGEEGVDTLGLAKNMIREVQVTDSNFSGKVAKISGKSMNKRDVAQTVKDYQNGALIIQKAGQMNEKTASDLYKELQQETSGIIVVLTDTKKAITRLFLNNTDLAGCFTAKVNLEALSNDALVAYGQKYAYNLEYGISEVGMLELHTRVAMLQTSEHVVTVAEVKEIVNEAIRRANRKTVGHFFDILLGKRYDAEDMIILTEKDFM